MKKVFISLLTVLYLLLSVGVTKSSHFCMGREMSVAFFSDEADGCFGAEKREMPCCDDITEVVSLEDEHQAKQFKTKIQATWMILPSPLKVISVDEELVSNTTLEIDTGPPEFNRPPIYITFNTLTFYG